MSQLGKQYKGLMFSIDCFPSLMWRCLRKSANFPPILSFIFLSASHGMTKLCAKTCNQCEMFQLTTQQHGHECGFYSWIFYVREHHLKCHRRCFDVCREFSGGVILRRKSLTQFFLDGRMSRRASWDIWEMSKSVLIRMREGKVR